MYLNGNSWCLNWVPDPFSNLDKILRVFIQMENNVNTSKSSKLKNRDDWAARMELSQNVT